MKSLGATIRLIREANGMSGSDLAEKLQVGKSYVSLLESDARKPSIDVLQKLADALKVPLGFLVDAVTGAPQAAESKELHGVIDEFDALERKLRRVIKELPGRSKTTRPAK